MINKQKKSPGFRSFWTKLFVDYFDKHLDQTIRENAGKWVVENSEVYNPFSDITNNASESNHARYKHLTEFKEHQIVMMLLFLHYLQKSDLHSIRKGFCDLGDLMLRRKFKCLKKDPAGVTLNLVLHPSKLMDIIRGKIMSGNQLTEECLGSQKGSPSDSLAENISVSNSEENTSVQGRDLKHQSSVKISSQEGHANMVIFDKGIALVPEMGGFMVKGENNKLYAVKLFPKESCQCPATGRCYHIIAARKRIN